MNEKNNTINMSNEEKTLAAKQKEELSPVRRREIVKTLMILFLAAMLILTFFSNTIMNRTLSEISTENAASGTLTETVRCGGMVISNQIYEVKNDKEQVVSEVKIKKGQSVKKDDVLFVLSSSGKSDLTAAEAELDALELDYQKSLLTVPADYSDKDKAIENAKEDLKAAVAKRDNAKKTQTERSKAKKQYDSDKKEAVRLEASNAKLSAAVTAIDSDDYSAASPELIGDLASLFKAYTNADSEYSSAYDVYKKAIENNADKSAIDSAKKDSDEKNNARTAAKSTYDKSKSSIRSSLSAELAKGESELSAVNGRIADYEASEPAEGMSYEELSADVTAKERALSDLIIEKQKAQSEQSVTDRITDLDIQAKKKAVDKQKKKVESLKKTTSSKEIKSKYDGVVSAVNVQVDTTAAPETSLAVIDITDEGYTVEASVDGDAAVKVKTGEKAEVLNDWGNGAEAVLTDIKNDTVSGSKNKILVFDVKGDVSSGTYLDISIPCGSAKYDTIVPKSCVYEDNNSKFVLKVISKNSPFGNRYYAERISVEVLASDEMKCAVRGNISLGDSIITAASKPVSAGDQVRMKDK